MSAIVIITIGGSADIALIYAAVSLIFAIIVLVGAVMLWIKPRQHVAWGVIVLLFSLFRMFSAGGLDAGLVLGTVGGTLGIAWKPPGLATRERPTAAFGVSLIAGIVMSAIASSLMIIGGSADILLNRGTLVTSQLYYATGLIFAIIVLVGAVMLWIKPRQHVAWGVIVLLFSLFTIISTGGFTIGLILGLVGGILGIAWKPPAPMAPGMAPPLMPPA